MSVLQLFTTTISIIDHPPDYDANILLIVIIFMICSPESLATLADLADLADRDKPLMCSPESSHNSVPPQGTGSRKPLEAVRQYRTLSINDKGYSLTSDVF